MRPLALLLALAFAAPVQSAGVVETAQVEPWRRVEIEGVLDVENAQGWNEHNREVWLMRQVVGMPWTFSTAIAFATEADYREAVRLNGALVRLKGVSVHRGWSRFVVVESLTEVRR
jgi:hypothetical protein